MGRGVRIGVWLLTLIGILANGVLFSQIEMEESPPGLKLSFVRQNNVTWYTRADFRYQLQKGKYRLDADLHHDNIYNSSRNTSAFVQLYVRSSIWQYYEVKPKLDVVSWIETNQFVNTQNEKYNVYAGVEYRPWQFLNLRPLVGYSLDRRSGRLDAGFSPALRVESDYRWSTGLTVKTRAFLRYKFIEPRRQYNLRVNQVWSKNFEKPTESGGMERTGTMVGGVQAAANELDDYVSNSVKRILSDTLRPFLNMDYSLTKQWNWDSRNEIQLHQRRFLYQSLPGGDTEFNNLAFSGLEVRSRQTLSYLGKKIQGYTFYEYESRNRDYELENSLDLADPVFDNLEQREKQKNFDSRQHLIEAQAQLQLAPKHQLKARYSGKYRQYDTPAEDNYDDRDEITYIGNVEWVGSWRPGFRTRYGFSGSYRHYAFLLKEKSQDNYKQRSLRFFFNFDWDFLENWRMEGNNALYVTYNVKDFEDFNLTDRSTRNLETNYRLDYRPIPDFHAKLSMNRRETHQSYLNWELFTETTLDTTVFLTLESSNRYFINLEKKQIRLYGDLGYKHFDQTKRFQTTMFNLSNELKAISLQQINLQTGPAIGLGFRGKNQSSIDLSVWFQYQIRKNRFVEVDQVNQYSSTQYEEELRRKTNLLFPYINLKLNYFLF